MTFFFLVSRHYPFSRVFTRLMVYNLSVGHYYGPHVVITAIFLGLGLLLNSRARRAVFLLDVVAVVLITTSIVDNGLTGIMGARLDWSLLSLTDNPGLMLKTIGPYLTWEVYASVAAGALLYAAGAWFLSRPRAVDRLSRGAHSAGFAYLALLLVATSYFRCALMRGDKFGDNPVIRILRTTPVVRRWKYDKLTTEELVQAHTELHLPTLMKNAERVSGPARESKRLNLVFIMLESASNEYLSLFGAPDSTQPLLSAWSDRMDIFANFFGNFPSSNHARFSSFNGLYSSQRYITYVNPRIRSRSLFEILHDQGYENLLFYSSFRNHSRFFDYVGHRNIDAFYDADNMPGGEGEERVAWGVREETTLAAMQGILRERANRSRPFSLTYIPAAPHMPYDTVDERFVVFSEGFGPLDGNYVGRYKNTLLYMDWIIASLMEALEAEGLLDRTLVVITSDHGELLGKGGGAVGHGRSLDPLLANIPLIIMNPERRGHSVNTVLGSHVDLLPTILDLLHIPLPEDDLYQGVSLYAATAGAHPIYLTSWGDRVVVEDGWYVLETDDGGGGVRVCRLYRIRNEGRATIFEPDGELDAAAAEVCKCRLDLFQQAQESLIRFYDDYRCEICRDLRDKAPSRRESEP